MRRKIRLKREIDLPRPAIFAKLARAHSMGSAFVSHEKTVVSPRQRRKEAGENATAGPIPITALRWARTKVR